MLLILKGVLVSGISDKYASFVSLYFLSLCTYVHYQYCFMG
jgi:hypothetical protein